VHKIVHGTTPGDVPVEFPPKLVMVIELKTAKELSLTMPPDAPLPSR
jgi:putative ABC transport system substrate-binding protein